MVFFIFLISNMGGCLTPIVDPPLLMGFMRGVPFFWSMHLLPILIFNLVILLFVFLLYRLFFIAKNAPDLLGSLIVSGIFIHIALQVVLNIAVVVNLIPTTGITLPFVSYGGTSIMFLMTEMALALGVSRQIRFQ